jgi:hypothetical protein
METGDVAKAKYTMIPISSRYFPILFPTTMKGKLKTKQRAIIPEGVIVYWIMDLIMSIGHASPSVIRPPWDVNA